MSGPEIPPVRLHEDADLFRAAVNFTAARTGFAARLIEKDYFCTALLTHLAANRQAVFKGGTCLAKVFAGFYRLSEDLDFAVPLAATATRGERRSRAAGMKAAVAGAVQTGTAFVVREPLRGANDSAQYVGAVGYASLLSGREETIKIEVSLREPLLTPAVNGAARTLLLDPVSGGPLVSELTLRCISRAEAAAEKFRAALTRREAAVRDYYDLDHLVVNLGIVPHDPALVELVRRKLAVPGNEPVNVGAERRAELRRQLDARLKPVLRREDFDRFDLDRAFDAVVAMAGLVAQTGGE